MHEPSMDGTNVLVCLTLDAWKKANIAGACCAHLQALPEWWLLHYHILSGDLLLVHIKVYTHYTWNVTCVGVTKGVTK